jgi:glycosyltransferase involved in cell wall biosynthesis
VPLIGSAAELGLLTNAELKMKVLHVIPSVGPLRGGPSFVIQAMTKGLAGRGCEVHVATTDDNGSGRLAVPLGCPVQRDGVTYRYFPRQTDFYTFSWPLGLWLSSHAAEFDLIHIHALFSFPATAAAYAASRHRVPYVIRPLGTLNRWGIENRRPWLKRASMRFIDGPAIRHAAAVHYTSEQERDEAAAVTPPHHAAVIPNPVDFRSERETASPEWLIRCYPQLAGKRTILFLSRIDLKKGMDLLLAAFAQVHAAAPDTALVVVGAGEEAYVENLKVSASTLGIEAAVVWTGFLEGAGKSSALSHASLFVLPSYSENFGVAVVEAMAFGLPVVTSDQVGIHREISAAGAGLVVGCKAELLADAILKLLHDGELRARLADNGRMLAQSFTVETVADRLIALYNRIVVSSGAQPGLEPKPAAGLVQR